MLRFSFGIKQPVYITNLARLLLIKRSEIVSYFFSYGIAVQSNCCYSYKERFNS